MSDNHESNGKSHSANGGGPKGPLSDTLAKPLAKRFYKDVSVRGGAFHQILLDERVVKTPAKRALMLPTDALGEAVAAEWHAQGEHIDPSTMPLTRFANTAIDAVADSLEDVAADIVGYAGRDLICYRAEAPDDLIAKQAAAWDPIVVWAEETLRSKLAIAKGVMPVDQAALAMNRFAAALEPHEPFKLTALHVITTLTGSAFLALALARGFRDADAVWAAAHVDEDYQIALWGEDYEAAERRKLRRADFDAAAHMLAALKG